jgi:uncharacterized protein (TIGR02246 family)
MKRVFLMMAIVFVTALFVSGQSKNAKAEARIRQIVADQVAAWNIGDENAFSANFAEDGSFTNIRGTVFYGHTAFVDRHREIFQGFFKGSKLSMTVSKIRFVRPDVAIADISTDISQLHGTPPGVKPAADGRIHTRLQEVYLKQNGRWLITSYHNVDVKEN